jgi:hypothetical protein
VNYPDFVGTFHLPPNVSGIIHNVSAVGFFGLLSYNSLFLFTKSSGVMSERKVIRNKIFKVCGIGMLCSLALMVPVAILGMFDIELWGVVWGVEAVALAFFGISWLTKSQIYPWLFADN